MATNLSKIITVLLALCTVILIFLIAVIAWYDNDMNTLSKIFWSSLSCLVGCIMSVVFYKDLFKE